MHKFYLYTVNKLKHTTWFVLHKVNELYYGVGVDKRGLSKPNGSNTLLSRRNDFISIYRDNLNYPQGITRTFEYKKYIKRFDSFVSSGGHLKDIFQAYRNRIKKKDNEEVGRINWVERNFDYVMPKQPGFNPTSFEYTWSIMNERIGVPLTRLMYARLNEYDPALPAENADLAEERIVLLSQMGQAIAFMSSYYFGFVNQWFDGSIDARNNYVRTRPTKEEVKAPKELTNHKFSNSIFPIGYSHKLKDHPRLFALNGSNITGIKRTIKKCILKHMSNFTNLYFYELDMNACHPQVFIQTGGKPTLDITKLRSIPLTESFFWDNLTLEFVTKTKIVKLVEKKPFRNAIKTSILAIMNGSSIGNKKHIVKRLKGKADKNGRSLLIYTSLLSDWLISLEICHVIKNVTTHWSRKKKVFPLGRKFSYASKDSPHKALTAIYCGVEVLALSYIVQYLLTVTPGILPLSLEGDGVLMASKERISRRKRRAICESISTLVLATIGMSFPMQITRIKG